MSVLINNHCEISDTYSVCNRAIGMEFNVDLHRSLYISIWSQVH